MRLLIAIAIGLLLSLVSLLYVQTETFSAGIAEGVSSTNCSMYQQRGFPVGYQVVDWPDCSDVEGGDTFWSATVANWIFYSIMVYIVLSIWHYFVVSKTSVRRTRWERVLVALGVGVILSALSLLCEQRVSESVFSGYGISGVSYWVEVDMRGWPFGIIRHYDTPTPEIVYRNLAQDLLIYSVVAFLALTVVQERPTPHKRLNHTAK